MSGASPHAFRRHCAVLGLVHVDSMAALNAAYRPLIAQWHPDRHAGSGQADAAAERAKSINAAYAYLSRAIAPLSTTSRATTAPVADAAPDESVLEIFIKSSSIVSVAYDSTTRALYIKFVGGRRYRYRDVPSGVLEELLAAPSRGAYANAHVIYRYPYDPC